MNFNMDPNLVEDILVTAVPVLVSGIPSCLFGMATYVLSALALYTVASRRGIRKAWLSWIPVLNVWILGSLSDQYRYVVKGQIKSKRKILLAFRLTIFLCGTIVFATAVFAVVKTVMNLLNGIGDYKALSMITAPVITAICVSMPIIALSIATAVIRFMALYDIYTSMDPGNNVLFLVLSIFLPMTEPFFLFFNRNKDNGMPPRKQPPVYEAPRYQPEEPVRESWQDTETDF